MIRQLVPSDTEATLLAAIGREAWPARDTLWTAADFTKLASDASAVVLADGPVATGLIILRLASDEAEVIDLAVRPAARRSGVARKLLAAAMAHCVHNGIVALFLEVGISNQPARALYTGAGFREVGRRKSYYMMPNRMREDALILRKDLGPPA